jgi:hypothetical protein
MNPKLYGVLVLCNIALVLLVGFTWILPAYTSFSRTREIVRLQENRLAAYQRVQGTHGGESARGNEGAGLQPVPYGELAAALAGVTYRGVALGLREVTLSAAEPIVHDYDGINGRGDRVLFEMLVSAVYEGEADALISFVREPGHIYIQGLQMRVAGEPASMRIIFSLFGISE